MTETTHRPAIYPPATLGLLGGGQLGRFFVRAAHELGYRVWVLDPDGGSPAGRIADLHLSAAYDDTEALDALARECAAVTTEFENVPAESLRRLARSIPVRPSADAIAICQDRIAEKTFLVEVGLPHAPWTAIRKAEDLEHVSSALYPGIIKASRFGYDGKGQARVASHGEALVAFRAMNGRPAVLESLLPLDLEVSVVLARDGGGRIEFFPAAENLHRNGILDTSIIPARVTPELANAARACAGQVAARLEYVGTLAVELFVSRSRLFVNEIAPRPHNSGHYTLDACITSQYEQQVRALCGLPLGSPSASSAAVMVNLLGDLWFADASRREPDWSRLVEIPNLKLHLYGKDPPRTGRKMGHFTVLGTDQAEVLATAARARAALGMT